MCNTNSRFILFLLTFFMIFNFMFEYKAHAEAIALSAGLVLFLKACAAAGVTYIAAKEVSRVTEDSIKLYNEWQKFIKNKPPNDKPPIDWEKTAFLTLLGLQMSDTFMKLVDSVKDFFKELGAKEGENKYYSGEYDIRYFEKISDINNYVFTLPRPSSGSNNYYRYFITDTYNIKVSVLRNVNIKNSYGEWEWNIQTSAVIFVNDKVSNETGSMIVQSFSSRPQGNDVYKIIASPNLFGLYTENGTRITSVSMSYFDDTEFVDVDVPSLSYFFERDSYQFTGNPDDIKPVYPNLKNLPEDKLLTVTDDNGKTSTYYKGSIDDLFNDWQKSQSAGNVFGDKPVNAVQTDDGIKIEDDADSLPYPEIPTEPQTDTPTALGQIITLLKQLVNWSSNIFNKIPEPQTEPEPNPLELPQKVELDFSPLQGLLVTDKFPFCLPWDLKRCVEKLISPGSPPRWEVEMVTEKFIIDFSQFETLAAISRSFFALIYVVALVVITRRFISGA